MVGFTWLNMVILGFMFMDVWNNLILLTELGAVC